MKASSGMRVGFVVYFLHSVQLGDPHIPTETVRAIEIQGQIEAQISAGTVTTLNLDEVEDEEDDEDEEEVGMLFCLLF